MPLTKIVPGSGQLLDPLPGDAHLRFEFLLYGSETDPHDAVTDIRGFIGRLSRTSLAVLDVENSDIIEPVYFADRSDLPRRRNAPAEIDRDNPVPYWFEQGFEISRTNDPAEMVFVGQFPVVARRYRMAVPEAAFPEPNSLALFRGISSRGMVPLTLLQLAVLNRPRRHRWYRAPFNIGVVAQVSIADTLQPAILHESPSAIAYSLPSLPSPVPFTGVVSDRTLRGTDSNGIAGVYLRIQDAPNETGNEFDFDTSLWRPAQQPVGPIPSSPSYKKMDLTDLGGGRWRYRYDWDGGLNGNWYYWSVTAIDNGGNEEVVDGHIFVDGRPPRLTRIEPPVGQGIVGDTATITVRVDDDFPHVAADFSIRHVETGNFWDEPTSSWVDAPTTFGIALTTEGPVRVATYTFTPGLDQATFELTVSQRDRAFNETVLVETIAYENLDQTSPEIVLVTPQSGANYPLGWVRIIGRVRDNFEIDPESAVLERYEILDDGSYSIVAAQGIDLFPNVRGWLSFGIFENLQDVPGRYRYLVAVSDLYGNQTVEEFFVTVGPS